MEIKKDSQDNRYIDLGVIRLTYVPASKRRSEEANWAGCDVLRIQAYQSQDKARLNPGPEYPLNEPTDILLIIAAIINLCDGK